MPVDVGRVVFYLRPGAPMDAREGEPVVNVCLRADGSLELVIPAELFGWPFVTYGDSEAPGCTTLLRFSIGGGDCTLGTGYVVRVGQDNEGRQYIRLPMAHEALPYIRVVWKTELSTVEEGQC